MAGERTVSTVPQDQHAQRWLWRCSKRHKVTKMGAHPRPLRSLASPYFNWAFNSIRESLAMLLPIVPSTLAEEAMKATTTKPMTKMSKIDSCEGLIWQYNSSLRSSKNVSSSCPNIKEPCTNVISNVTDGNPIPIILDPQAIYSFHKRKRWY